MNILQNLIKLAQNKGAGCADAINFTSNSTSVATRLGKLENIERSESQGIGLRVIIGKKQAIVSSTDINPDAMNELADRAVAMARLAPDDKYISLADESLLCTTSSELDLLDNSAPSAEDLLAMALKAENTALAVPGITNSEGADASAGMNIVSIATSSGFSGEYKTSMFSISASVLAGTGTHMERDYDFSSARHMNNLENPEKIGQIAAERALKRLNPKRVKTCVVPVIFDPRVSKSLVGAFASAVNGASVARNATFLKSKMDTKIFGNNISIINDPHIKRGLGSKPYDAEGVRNYKMPLVTNGILQNWLLDVRSANQLGLITNGCAARGIASNPSPSTSNLYMENGQDTPEDLISGIKSGFYVTETFGMGVNIITGDYSQGASGFWIENGQISYPVSELTIAGSLPEMFLQAIPANDLEFHYSTNAPTILIEKMTVAGG